LVFVTFPLNLLVYGWNDLVDKATDRINPRKDSWLFGAAGDDRQLATLPPVLISVGLGSAAFFAVVAGPITLLAFVALAVVLFAYNHPTRGLRGLPPWELLCQAAYLLVVPLSISLNDVDAIPWPTWIYLVLFALQSHLIGEVLDVEPDRRAGRRTTATIVGVRGAKLLIIAIVAAEVAMLFLVYEDFVFGGMLAGGLLWLMFDLAWLFRARGYTLTQMRLFGVGANGLAVGSMVYVWWTRCLLELP
jgi:4-hydroxybenzoate polyprenyltransferase